MKKTQEIMAMPVTIEILDSRLLESDFEEVFSFFRKIDEQFSPFKDSSEVAHVDRGGGVISREMKEVLILAEKTKRETEGHFSVWRSGRFDPSGVVKGWAIQKAYDILRSKGYKNFYINAGGDIQVSGKKDRKKWKVGIKNPFNTKQIIKVVGIDGAIATSGTYEKGNHIYNPLSLSNHFDILSLTVIAPNILDADCIATGAFAMGKDSINFLERKNNMEGYMIDTQGIATMTSGFEKYIVNE